MKTGEPAAIDYGERQRRGLRASGKVEIDIAITARILLYMLGHRININTRPAALVKITSHRIPGLMLTANIDISTFCDIRKYTTQQYIFKILRVK